MFGASNEDSVSAFTAILTCELLCLACLLFFHLLGFRMIIPDG